MSVEVTTSHRMGAFVLDAAFSTGGGLTALFGPSGAGKTSVVNVIAGLLRPAYGRVVVGGRVLLDTERRIVLPPHARRVGYVFQEPRLFPHLTVRQNLLYGHWFTRPLERRERFDRVVDLLGLEPHLHRGPTRLSGGEKQRVAIGRALLSSPHLLLMDEPLAGLDDARKAEVLPYIERIRDEDGIPIIYVSHSVPEVNRLATTLVVLSQGRVVATGAVTDLLPHLDLFPADPPTDSHR